MNKIAIVTGASRGIGAATAIELAKRGYQIAVNYRTDLTAANAVVDQIMEFGGKAITVHADISQEDQVTFLFEQCIKRLGRPTALVNNAGVLQQQTSLQGISLERLKAVFETNVYGTFLCCREAIKHLPQHSGAAIVNLSSLAARTGSPNEYVDYAASKSAVDTLTVGLAKEVAKLGIRVNSVRPGMIKTEIHAAGGEPNRVERLAAAIPMGRGGEASEVANVIAWLISEQASYTTGSLIDIAGGL